MHCAMTYEFQFLRELVVFGGFSVQIIEVLKEEYRATGTGLKSQ